MPNRLAHEDSPYLQQHKENPFDWYPWCAEAFAKAKNEHKAIFISIGYSSCHWCHVMEHDVFKNEEIAAFMNDHFVCIKVDREERPDIDKHFQEVHTLLNRRSGGWPLSIFCTPQNKPFYAGTYIPPYNRERMMGFSELSAIIAEKVAQNDEKLFQNADEIAGFLRPAQAPTQATHLTLNILSAFTKQASHNFDGNNGGFSEAPKFPLTSTIDTLMSIDRLSSDEAVRTMVTQSLDSMQQGGIYDLVDGGFCRYSTDAQWLIPHFEKMGYDNALLCELYAKAALHYSNSSYLRCAKESADFMIRFMMEEDLYYSASDADTEGEEGQYFIYSYDEILKAMTDAGIDKTQHEAYAKALGAVPEGNFEGHCVLRFERPERPEWFEMLRPHLQNLRQSRPYPFIDRKVITAWNAMMIKALLVLGRLEPSYTQAALRSLEKLQETMMPGGVLYHSALIGRAPKIGAFLEDYAYLSVALIEAYRSTLDEIHLIEAQRLANKALELFYENGKWYFSRGDFPTEAELDDGTYPSALGQVIDALLSLGTLVDPKYRHFAFKSLEYVSIKLMKTPIYYPKLAAQTIRYLHEERIIKGPKEMLSQSLGSLNTLPYPFAEVKSDETLSEFIVCGSDSCFASTKEAAKLERLIRDSLPNPT